ncbi:MAG: ABC transporter ATP-binding protein [Alphaproteobacteria bacterium]|nr:ABC transporter ATP-binding protein [Alphaproteobacteria bacterium]
MADASTVLEISGLRTSFARRGQEIVAVDDVSLSIAAGETLALVGESGSGKSVTGLSILRLLPRGVGRIVAGSIRLRRDDGPVDLVDLDDEAMRGVRGAAIGMVFQEPMTSLNPVLTIGDQIGEPLRVHEGLAGAAARARVLAMLAAVGIPDPERRLGAYPHELSGGMRQRAMIAMALICRPRLLIADEPTTALDTTIQAQIVELLERLQRELGMAILFITHNLGLVGDMAHRVAIMYAGRLVEHGPVAEVFDRPRHPYTRGLLASVPRPGEARALRRAGGRLAAIPGHVPNLRALPAGCVFSPRCDLAADPCRAQRPPMMTIAASRGVRCLRWAEL